MGSLQRFNLQKAIDTYKTEYFFETGTWRGEGVNYANQFGFKKIYSTEIIKEFADKAKQRFTTNKNIEIFEGNSFDGLHQLLPQITGNCVFWLDAHYPAADEGIVDYNNEKDEDIKLPLEKELEIIAARKGKYGDVILIDDLRIYEDGPYTKGNMPKDIAPPKNRNAAFFAKIFGNTHNVIKSYKDEGYVLLLPKNISNTPTFLEKISMKLKGKIF